jgi:tight adherence protein B
MNAMTWCAGLCVGLAVAVAAPPSARLASVFDHRSASPRMGEDPMAVLGALARRFRRPRDHERPVRVAAAWSAELSAGRPAATALVDAMTRARCGLEPQARRIALGDDPAAVLAELAGGATSDRGFAALRACWIVASDAGAALADTVRRTESSLRAEQAMQDEIAAQLAAPRATARMVACLPLVGPLLGLLVGADSMGVLLTTPIGRGLLVGGLVLNLLGVWWVSRLVRGARRTA